MNKLMVKIFNISLIVLFSRSNPKNNKQEVSTNNITHLLSGDNEISRFKDSAQAHIDYLIEFMAEYDGNDSLFRYFVKSNFNEGYINEHMWSQVYSYKNGYFIGTLGNEPINIKKLKFNDTVKISKKDIEDWIL